MDTSLDSCADVSLKITEEAPHPSSNMAVSQKSDSAFGSEMAEEDRVVVLATEEFPTLSENSTIPNDLGETDRPVDFGMITNFTTEHQFTFHLRRVSESENPKKSTQEHHDDGTVEEESEVHNFSGGEVKRASKPASHDTSSVFTTSKTSPEDHKKNCNGSKIPIKKEIEYRRSHLRHVPSAGN